MSWWTWWKPKPQPPKPQPPPVRTVAIVLPAPLDFDAYLDDVPRGHDVHGVAGYAAIDGVPQSLTDTYVTVNAVGYKPYFCGTRLPKDNLQIWIGGPPDAGIPNSLHLPALEPIVTARPGIPRLVGKAVTDDAGLFHPLGTTLFWGLWGWKNDRDRLLKNLDWVGGKHFDYVRTLGQVSWTGREVDPTWPDYQDVLAGYLDACYERGFKVELTAIGGGLTSDPLALADKIVAVVLAGRQHKIMNHEGANESSSTFPDLNILGQVAAKLKQTGNLTALSSPGDWAALKDKTNQVGLSLFSIHTDRSPDDYGWKQVRQGWDFKDLPYVVTSNEPPGPNSSVAQQTDPLRLALMRAVGVMSGGALFVLHTGAGIYGRENDHPAGGHRPANLWETPNIDAIVAAVQNINALLPQGVENWTRANTQWSAPLPVAPFQPNAHWPSQGPNGVNKAYAALDGARFIQIPIGVRNAILTASYPIHYEVHDPLTLQTVMAGDLDTRGQIALAGDPSYNAGYVILGNKL